MAGAVWNGDFCFPKPLNVPVGGEQRENKHSVSLGSSF